MLGRIVNPVGKAMQSAFQTGAPFREQLTNIKNTVGDTSLVRNYNKTAGPLADEMQDALVKLIGGDSVQLGGMKEKASRMAASDEVKNILQAVPGLAAAYGTGVVLDAGKQLGDPESTQSDFGNTAMDLLGMGAGAYGINRGFRGMGGTTSPLSALLMASGAGVGKMGTDAVQAVLGM